MKYQELKKEFYNVAKNKPQNREAVQEIVNKINKYCENKKADNLTNLKICFE